MLTWHDDWERSNAMLGDAPVGYVIRDRGDVWEWRALGWKYSYQPTEAKARAAVEAAVEEWVAKAGLTRIEI